MRQLWKKVPILQIFKTQMSPPPAAKTVRRIFSSGASFESRTFGRNVRPKISSLGGQEKKLWLKIDGDSKKGDFFVLTPIFRYPLCRSFFGMADMNAHDLAVTLDTKRFLYVVRKKSYDEKTEFFWSQTKGQPPFCLDIFTSIVFVVYMGSFL